jgi:hypothetical protein
MELPPEYPPEIPAVHIKARSRPQMLHPSASSVEVRRLESHARRNDQKPQVFANPEHGQGGGCPKAGSERVTSSAIVGQTVQPAQNLRLVPLSDLVEDSVG